jgi:alkylation response protein AidB-like acyl-CoA dehydrogenase
VLNGAKAWTTHGGQADFYKVMARTSDDAGSSRGGGISCFLVPADTPGLSADVPEDKMGLTGSTTATMLFDNVRIPAERRLGAEGDGLRIALAGLDSGRLGIAAVAVGLAQGALDNAVAYAKERETFGKRIIDEGLPGRAVHARGQGDADLRGHQPDPADGDQPRAGEGQQRHDHAGLTALTDPGPAGGGTSVVRSRASHPSCR